MIYIIHVLFSGGGVHRRWGEAHPAGRCCPLSPPSMLHPGIPHLLPATLPRPSLPFLLYTRDTYLLYTCTSPTLSVQPRLSTPLKSLRCVDWVWGLIVAYIVWWFWWFQFQNILKYFEIYKIFWNILKYIAWCCWWFHCSWILFQQKCLIIASMMILMVAFLKYFKIVC